MRPPPVVECQIATDRGPGLADGAVCAQVNLLVFDRAPEALDDDIVPPRLPAVHADGDLLTQQYAGEGQRRELAALIRIENLRLAVARQGFLQRLDAEAGFHRDRYSPRQNLAAEPIDDGNQMDGSKNLAFEALS